ncbi:phage tail sheath subtilisin-like domain-containing protein [Streptomyces sp. BYX5S]
MAVSTNYPGVYIDEFEPAPPIQGVGTSTAAFVGRALSGPVGVPVKVTRWERFQDVYGTVPRPGTYLWYAVRGFFENGGNTCYVVRASDATTGQATFDNRAGHAMFTVRARRPGRSQPAITVTVSRNPLVSGAELYRPTGNVTVAAVREFTADSEDVARRFRPGDEVDFGGADRRVPIASVSGTAVRTTVDLQQAVGTAGALRLVNTRIDTRTVRIAATEEIAPKDLVAGTVLTITQGAGANRAAATRVVESAQAEGVAESAAGTDTWTYRVTFRTGLDAVFDLAPGDPPGAAGVESEEFDITVAPADDPLCEGLSADPAHPRYFVRVVNAADLPASIEPEDPPPADTLPDALPAQVVATALPPGQDETVGPLGAGPYTTAVGALRTTGDVNLVAVPDSTDGDVQRAVLDQCVLLSDRFAVMDAQPGLAPGDAALQTQRNGLESVGGFAALYYPWLRVPAADGSGSLLVPPSGHVCGAIAQVDGAQGVFKAPANVRLNGCSDIQASGAMTNQEQGGLNLLGINVIRVFRSGGPPTLWGARTATTNTNWVYISTRRLFLFLEESIQEGIRWAVFEPNDLALWQKLKRSLTAFLFQQWRDGALFGETAERAFYVRIDEGLNPFSQRQLGRLNIEIGVQPAYPAEFIVVRIGIWDGGAEITE